jgi:hypothetical protein
MIYKFIDNNGSEITINSLSSLKSLIESKSIKENTKIKAGLRGKWTVVGNLEELKEFFVKKEEEVIAEVEKQEEDIKSFITKETPEKKTSKSKPEPEPESEPEPVSKPIEIKKKKTSEVKQTGNDLKSDEELEKEKKSEEPKKKKEFFIKVLWRGDYSLGLSYWAFYQLPGFFLSLFAVAGEESALGPSATTGFLFFYLIVVWLGIFYVIIAMVGSWKSATKYKKEKISKNLPYGWAIAAYITITLGGLSMAVEFIREIVSPSI